MNQNKKYLDSPPQLNLIYQIQRDSSGIYQNNSNYISGSLTASDVSGIDITPLHFELKGGYSDVSGTDYAMLFYLSPVDTAEGAVRDDSFTIFYKIQGFLEHEPQPEPEPEPEPEIPNVPEDITYSTPQDIGTFSQGTSISITGSLSNGDEPNNNISYTFALSRNIGITELNFTATNYDGDYANFYYVIQENTSSIITQSNNTLQEKNVVESYIEFSNGTQNLLNVGHTTVTLENIGEVDKRYVLVFYTLDADGGATTFSNSGRLNRYLLRRKALSERTVVKV